MMNVKWMHHHRVVGYSPNFDGILFYTVIHNFHVHRLAVDKKIAAA